MAAPTSTFFLDFHFGFPPLMASPPLLNLRLHPAGLRPLLPVQIPPRRSSRSAVLLSLCASQNRLSFSATQTSAPIHSQYFDTEQPARSFPFQDRGPWLPKGPAKAAGRCLAPGNAP